MRAVVERRQHRGRGAQHPRAVATSRAGRPRRRAAPLPRGERARLRRPRRVRRRPGVRRRAARGPALATSTPTSGPAGSTPTRPPPSRWRAGDVDGLRRRLRRAAADGAAARGHGGLSTTHLTTADRWGNVVVVHADHRADRRLRHRGARPRVPAQQRAHRLHCAEFDAARPQPDPARQAAAQLDVADDRAPGRHSRVLAVGSPGGSTIITTVLQVLLNRFDRGS